MAAATTLPPLLPPTPNGSPRGRPLLASPPRKLVVAPPHIKACITAGGVANGRAAGFTTSFNGFMFQTDDLTKASSSRARDHKAQEKAAQRLERRKAVAEWAAARDLQEAARREARAAAREELRRARARSFAQRRRHAARVLQRTWRHALAVRAGGDPAM